LKIRHALRGLVLQVGTQVEPMYTGPLFGLILNLSSKDVKIFEGEDILTVEFHTLTSLVNCERETIDGLQQFLKHEHITDPVESSLTSIKSDITNSLSTKLRLDLEQYVRTLHSDWEQRRTNRMAVGFSFVILLISLVLGAGLPIYINKTTLDRDDTLYHHLRINKAADQIQNDQAFDKLMKILRDDPSKIDKLDQLLEQLDQKQSPAPSTK